MVELSCHSPRWSNQLAAYAIRFRFGFKTESHWRNYRTTYY